MTSNHSKFVIIHTNDLHSQFENMPAVAGTIANLKQKYDENHVIVIDLGDHMEKAEMMTDASEGLANVEIMNAAGYDLITLGNRELLTFSKERLSLLMGEKAAFTVVCSNLQLLGTAEPPTWMKPYVIIEKDDLRISIIAFTVYLPKFYKPLGWHIDDPIQSCKGWVEQLRSEVDFLIVMSHLGFDSDQQLAEEVPGIDLIIGSHSHTLLQQPAIHHGCYILQAGSLGNHVGVAEINFELNSRTVAGINSFCLSTKQEEADDQTVSLIAEHASAANEKFSCEIAQLTEPMTMEWDQETPLGNLLASGVRACVNAEIGIINAGQFVTGLPAGNITSRHLLQSCPSPARPCKVVIKGKHILQALEEALLPAITDRPIGGFGFSGKVVGTLCLDGLHVEFDPSRPPYQKINSVWVHDQLLEYEKEYTVGTVDAFTFGLAYSTLGNGSEPTFPYPEPMRQVLKASIQNNDHVQDCFRRRWHNL